MSIESVYDAIDAQLETFGTAGGGTFKGTVALMNVTVVPVAGVPYVVSQMIAYVRKALTLGRDKTFAPGGYLAEHRGIYQVEAVIPQDSGRPLATQLQTRLLALFPRGTTLTGSDGQQVNFDAPTPMPLITQEGWVRAPCQFPWYSFEAS